MRHWSASGRDHIAFIVLSGSWRRETLADRITGNTGTTGRVCTYSR